MQLPGHAQRNSRTTEKHNAHFRAFMTAYRGATGPRAMLGQAPAPAAGRRRGPRRAPSAMGHAGAPGRHQAGTVDQARHQHGQRLVGSTSSSRPARRAPSIKPGASTSSTPGAMDHAGAPGHQASRPAPSGTPGASARPAGRAPSATGHAGAPAPAPGRAPWIRPGASTGSAWWAAPAAGRRMDQAGRHRLRHQLGQPR